MLQIPDFSETTFVSSLFKWLPWTQPRFTVLLISFIPPLTLDCGHHVYNLPPNSLLFLPFVLIYLYALITESVFYPIQLNIYLSFLWYVLCALISLLCLSLLEVWVFCYATDESINVYLKKDRFFIFIALTVCKLEQNLMLCMLYCNLLPLRSFVQVLRDPRTVLNWKDIWNICNQ